MRPGRFSFAFLFLVAAFPLIPGCLTTDPHSTIRVTMWPEESGAEEEHAAKN